VDFPSKPRGIHTSIASSTNIQGVGCPAWPKTVELKHEVKEILLV